VNDLRYYSHSGHQHTPVIVWTGKDLAETEQRHLQSSAAAIVTKSQSADDLLRELKHCLQREL
jgi:hypothetical protein